MLIGGSDCCEKGGSRFFLWYSLEIMDEAQNLEVEVKFVVEDLTAVRQRLLAAGATVKKPRVYERNLRLDTPDEALRERDELLRLRQDTAVKVTYKGRSLEAEQASEAKVREELEMTVGDWETAVAIFQRLGFVPMQVYEKYRETFQLGGVEVVLDEMPYGNFVELEGEEAAIQETAVALDLPWENRLVTNYLALMGELQARHNLPFNDITFANFADYQISVQEALTNPKGESE